MARANAYKNSLLVLCTLMAFILLSAQVRGQVASPGTPREQTAALHGFKVRGVHLDLRIQVMRLPALKKLALKFSKAGINTIIMEWEASYPYQADGILSNRYAYSPDAINNFINYCDSLHIDVIPLQQSFGHVEYILRHQKYAALREDEKDLSQVCPSKPALNRALFTRLYQELITVHHSKYIHIGGDETHLLGHCPLCQKAVDSIGVSGLYFNHIKMLCDIVVGLGKRPVLWADIALKYPEYIHLLPKGTVFIDWNYGWSPNRFGALDKLLNSGYEIWGALSIRSYPDNYYQTDWMNHFNNIRDFIPFCRKNHYQGMIMTSWSTSGVYTPVYESEHTIVDLNPVRRCYPISGFDLLISAYLKALQQEGPLQIKTFIRQYCRSRFGFNSRQADAFIQALLSKPYEIRDGEVVENTSMNISEVLDSALAADQIFHLLRPRQGQRLFAHYALMQDIRVYYLRYKQIEQKVNTDQAFRLHKSSYLKALKELQEQGRQLNQRFKDLNQALLYPTEIATENRVRSRQVDELYDRLAEIK